LVGEERTPWTCYILECADGTLYTGITNDVEKRLLRHGRGLASKYTRVRRPVRLVHAEAFPDRSEAARREARIRRLPREEKLALAGWFPNAGETRTPAGARPEGSRRRQLPPDAGGGTGTVRSPSGGRGLKIP
jgi:putative endonuclease